MKKHTLKKWLVLLLVLLLLPLCIRNGGQQVLAEASEDSEDDTFTIYFFHETTCGTCDGTSEFIEVFNEAVGDIKEQYNYELQMINTFVGGGSEKLDEVLASIGKTRDDISLPVLIIGEDTVSGLDDMSTQLRDLFIKYGEGYQATYVEVEPTQVSETTDEDLFTDVTVDPEDSFISFFYTLSCEDCAAAESYFETLPESVTIDGKESKIVIDAYSIADPDGMEKVRKMFDTYNVPEEDQKVPIVFYSGGYIAGAENIKAELMEHLEAGDCLNFSYPAGAAQMDPLTAKDLPGIAVTGFINGFNPCSISILFLLLSLIMMEKKRILKIGMTFIGGKFITYLVLGLGLYSIISVIDLGIFSRIQSVINIILVAVAVFLALLNLWDFFAVLREDYGRVKAQLPAGLRRFNNNVVKKVMTHKESRFLLPLIFLAAVIISAGEFLCTGQIYLGTIIYMLKRGTGSMTITVLAFLIYITCMCLPQAVMVLLVRGGANVMSLTESTRHKFPIIKMVNFLLFAGFAVLLILTGF